jgi:hypothetical protein
MQTEQTGSTFITDAEASLMQTEHRACCCTAALLPCCTAALLRWSADSPIGWPAGSDAGAAAPPGH